MYTNFWVRGIYLLYYLGIFLFLILPNSVYHYYWLSKYKITHKENSIYIYCAYSHNFENSINTQPLSYIYDFTYRKYSILYCSGIYSNYSMHLPNNKFMYTSMYLSLLSTSSITKASVNPFWQFFFPHMSNANCVCKSLATVLLKAVFNPIWCFLKGLTYCFKTHTYIYFTHFFSLCICIWPQYNRKVKSPIYWGYEGVL